MSKRREDWRSQNVGYRPQAAERPRASGVKGRARRKVIPIRVAAFVLCLGVAVTCAVLLINYVADYIHSKSLSDELERTYQQAKASEQPAFAPAASPAPAPAPTREALPAAKDTYAPAATPPPARTAQRTYAGNEGFKSRSAIDALQKKSRDVIGWLSIEDVLSEPVVWRDNTYYLTHDYLGKKSATGALFMDENCRLYPVPECIVLHGHNMKTGAMFGSLKKYKVKGASYFRDHGYIHFETVYEDATYVVFAVAMVDVRPSESAFLNFCGNLTFATDRLFISYVSRIKTLSLYDINVDVAASDRLLILSTCDGEDDNLRLIVAARLVRPDEDMGALNIALSGAKPKRTY